MNTKMLFQDLLDETRFLQPIQEKLEVKNVVDRSGRMRPETSVVMVCRVLFQEKNGSLNYHGKVNIPQRLFTWEGANNLRQVETMGFLRVK